MTPPPESEPAASHTPDEPLNTTSPLRTRRFATLVSGWTLANVSDSLLTIILAAWVVDLTGNPALGGVAFAMMGLPAFAAPFLGYVVDRTSRRKVLVVAYSIGALCVLPLLLVSSKQQVWIVFLVTVIYSCISYVTSSCQSGILKDALPTDALGRANGVLSSVDQTLRMGMPFAGAAIYAVFGIVPLIVVSSTTFFCAAAVFASVRLNETSLFPDKSSVVANLLAGFRHLFSTKPLNILSWSVLVAMASLGVVNGVVFAALQQLGIPAAWAGPLTVGQGIGGIFAGFLVSRLMDRFGRPTVYGVGIATLGFGLVPFATGPVFLLAASQLVVGFSATVALVAYVTECQVLTPNQLQGRVSAAGQAIRNLPSVFTTLLAAGATAWIDYRILLLGTVGVLVTAGTLPAYQCRKTHRTR